MRSRPPVLFHLLAAAWILAMMLAGNRWPGEYRMLLQEDRSVEWATVWLFLMAGVAGARRSIGERRWFDGLVAFFCLFVAGEEFSWGQRLVWYYPAEFFLANNFQQEVNLHNLPQSFLQPKWILMIALAGYGLLPLLSRSGRTRALVSRVGATAPPFELLPWFIPAIVLLYWYPLTLTGEWVELLAGSLFLMSVTTRRATAWTAFALAAGFGAAMTTVTGALERGRDVGRIECATTEVRSLVDDVAAGQAGTVRLWRPDRVHKRIWSSIHDGYLQSDSLRRFNTALCGGSAGESAGVRHTYGIDPWGSPYWLLVEHIGDEGRRVTAYSFGPNRRRDRPATVTSRTDVGDDVLATSVRRAKRN